LKAGPQERMITINIIYLKDYCSQIDNKCREHEKDKIIKNINKLACNLNYKYLPSFLVNKLGEDLQKQAN